MVFNSSTHTLISTLCEESSRLLHLSENDGMPGSFLNLSHAFISDQLLATKITYKESQSQNTLIDYNDLSAENSRVSVALIRMIKYWQDNDD